MYSEFAYSQQMQLLLALVTYTEKFLSSYMISNIILTAFHFTASRRQKVIFSIISGPLLQTTFVYIVYFIGGMMSFSNLQYHLIVNPNPITALLYYYTAQTVLKLPPARSVKLMSYIYLFWISMNALNRLIGAAFFVQNAPKYNYLLDASQQTVTFVLFFMICVWLLLLLKKSNASLNFSENMFFDKKKELFGYFMKVSFVYAVTVSVPIVLSNQLIAHIIVALVLVLFIVMNLCVDMMRYNKQTISNRDVHISALFKGLEELRGIKHDFNNILHTYSGYLELGEYERLKAYHSSLVSATSQESNILEVVHKMPENPAIASLLIDKMEYAERMSVRLLTTLKCDIEDFYIDSFDVAGILSCLLDNAIEMASCSEQRKVYCSIESKQPGSKLIIITNSSSGADVQEKTSGTANADYRRQAVRNILSKYGNCSFMVQNREQEVFAYIELKAIG